MRACVPKVLLDPGAGTLSMLFPDVRMLSHNEILAALQYRKYEIFRYKALWREKVGQALALAGLSPDDPRLPAIFGPHVRLILFRQARRSLDRDSAQAVFKFAIDALVQKKKKGPDGVSRVVSGILADDARDVVVDLRDEVSTGPWCVGLRIERVDGWSPPTSFDVLAEWFGEVAPGEAG